MTSLYIQSKLEEALRCGRTAERSRYIVKAAIRAAQMMGRPVRSVEDLERAIGEYRAGFGRP